MPTFTELGMPALEVTTWFALVAPTGTPKPIIDRLQMETAKILQSGDVKELLAKQGAIARTSTPLELGQFMRQESEKWSKIIKDAGIQAE